MIVFCEAESRSVPVAQCESCPFIDRHAHETDGDDLVECGRSVLPIAVGNTAQWNFPPAVAAALPVGLALVRPVLCVEGALPWVKLVHTLVLPESPHGVPIVDGSGALVGTLPSAAIARAGGDAAIGAIGSVADRAVSAASVHETESLGDAFATMGVHRVRELTVVGDGFQVVGILRDVDALRFVAHVARTGDRPGRECAARERPANGPVMPGAASGYG